MRRSILDIINSSPQSRQSRNPHRTGRDAYLVNSAKYAIDTSSIVTSTATVAGNNGFLGLVLLRDRRVFCANWGNNQTCAVYNPGANSVISVINGDGSFNNNNGSAVLLKDGRVFLPPYAGSPAYGRIYDPATNTIAAVGSGFGSENYFGASSMLDGRVFITPYYSTIPLIFNPITNSYTNAPITTSGGTSNCTMLLDGRIIYHAYGTLDFHLFDCFANIFEIVTVPALGDDIYLFGCCLLADGRVLFLAESGTTNVIYNPFTKTITKTTCPFAGDYIRPRLLPDGRVLIIGSNRFVTYNPVSNAYSQTLFGATGWRSTLVLPDGRIFIASRNTTATQKFGFIGQKLPRNLPDARVLSPIYNK